MTCCYQPAKICVSHAKVSRIQIDKQRTPATVWPEFGLSNEGKQDERKTVASRNAGMDGLSAYRPDHAGRALYAAVLAADFS
jgi:hypothetical protein